MLKSQQATVFTKNTYHVLLRYLDPACSVSSLITKMMCQGGPKRTKNSPQYVLCLERVREGEGCGQIITSLKPGLGNWYNKTLEADC